MPESLRERTRRVRCVASEILSQGDVLNLYFGRSIAHASQTMINAPARGRIVREDARALSIAVGVPFVKALWRNNRQSRSGDPRDSRASRQHWAARTHAQTISEQSNTLAVRGRGLTCCENIRTSSVASDDRRKKEARETHDSNFGLTQARLSRSSVRSE